MVQSILKLTASGAAQLQLLLDKRSTPSLGIRIGIRTQGCSGLAYTLEYADNINENDEVLIINDLTILIEHKAIMFLLGTEMDFVKGSLSSGFIFRNPNEKGRCGCGDSFHV